MRDPREQIEEAFEHGGTVQPSDFDFLVQFLNDQEQNPDGAVELLDLSVGFESTSVTIVLLVQQKFVGVVCQLFADAEDFPAPFSIDVLNHADPNPGQTVLIVSWGGGR